LISLALRYNSLRFKQQIAITSEKINEVDEKLNTLQQGYLEHVGGRERHLQFLREAWRVSVIEFHMIRREFFASEDKLNLLSREALACLASAAGITKTRQFCFIRVADEPDFKRKKAGRLGDDRPS
jgi:hypothetical protein